MFVFLKMVCFGETLAENSGQFCTYPLCLAQGLIERLYKDLVPPRWRGVEVEINRLNLLALWSYAQALCGDGELNRESSDHVLY